MFCLSFILKISKNELFFESQNSIEEVFLTESLLIVHQSQSVSDNEIIVFNRQGEILLSWEVEGTYFQYEVNPYDENIVFLTSFDENWVYRTYEINLEMGKVTKSLIEEPFIEWVSKNEYTYLAWSQEIEETTAPLVLADVNSEWNEIFAENVIEQQSLKEGLMYVSMEDEDRGIVKYHFYSMIEKQEWSFFEGEIKQEYHEWIIPPYTVDWNGHMFYTFILNGDSYTLVQFNIDTGEQVVLKEHLDPKAIQVSPFNKLLLYGEKQSEVFSLETGIMKSLIK
ncbi:hypothetical protein LC087_07440 [Bacillus carboniphilus]|uniref:YqgU-like 6-bladed beta-propeller domain-containing protein n=1 Tax=Bacillus carboniphilus TaxID=86663 RepID=A0ABY9JYS0_9BACI|nr:hypothetical protein [Bacillus carboniphilus]WLR43934.1 hypothetical protein LC087_07440 [Bacillus carboniphilus]